ncbi:MAG: 5-guanidino-2-oxopentanoate decarboxylase [Defluviimonas sp.]|uniref:5-guanidino-2-oxopentanoate decarboxylase n=1 Tax=Albidovulum sp. TaxID=1872424 RepID=UPI001DAF2DAF|nr:5-guanidino-2-oxopentanoate decarboxylase [Paracoccaceae bacterium]MCC0064387.1 5-guanidino-2-oxopentanoate decarboxylase [Defluviimonas sp.]
MTTVGEQLVRDLEEQGVDTVFGIPGVHTIELYRGLAGARIRHVTPRHEQGAGFMADGYARVSGRPGVAFVITGPGLTNALTPMGQARADSIPMLVVSGVNARPTLGLGHGHLHELPDQSALAAGVALTSTQVAAPEDLSPAIADAFATLANARPGPMHIEVPLDVMPLPAATPVPAAPRRPPEASDAEIAAAARILSEASSPVILVGGGAKFAGAPLRALAERLDAPVVQTSNARGLMHGHPLIVPASPSLDAVRALLGAADAVLAVGTEFGPTDYDMYARGGFPRLRNLVRIDIDAAGLGRHPADLGIHAAAEPGLARLVEALGAGGQGARGAPLAAATREAALAEIGPAMAARVAVLEAIRDTLPGAIIVGDSTQAIYAGNLCYDHDRPAGWFNAATGFGALGYAIPAAIGAALAAPSAPVVCLAGDGGAQFTLPELMTAVDEKLPIRFLIWNNRAYQEIADAMQAAGIEVIGCDPTPPDFAAVAASCAMPYLHCAGTPEDVAGALRKLPPADGPVLIEIDAR